MQPYGIDGPQWVTKLHNIEKGEGHDTQNIPSN